MARKQNTARGQQNELKGDEGASRIYGTTSRGLGENLHRGTKEIFDKFHDCWSKYMSLSEAAIFEYAFKLGMQMAIETLIN
jgi:hypothetical protein